MEESWGHLGHTKPSLCKHPQTTFFVPDLRFLWCRTGGLFASPIQKMLLKEKEIKMKITFNLGRDCDISGCILPSQQLLLYSVFCIHRGLHP